MADEAVIIELLGNGGDPVSYTCLDAMAIPKGTLLVLSDARLVDKSGIAGKAFAGIAAHEKVASDGSTRIAVYTNGIFDIKCSAITTAGNDVSISGVNAIGKAFEADYPLGSVVGRALETADASEVIAVRVKA